MPIDPREFKPDPQSTVPLHLQLAGKLSEAVAKGAWGGNEPLPSERTLSEALKISRVTARNAITILCKRGVLTRKHGSGTYVAPPLQAPSSGFGNFAKEPLQHGFVPGTKWLSRETGAPTAAEMLALRLSPNVLVTRLRRLCTADNIPVAIEYSTIPAQYLPDPRIIDGTLYNYLDSQNLLPVRALQQIRAINAAAEHVRYINIKKGEAMLYVKRVGYLENGEAIELTQSFFHNDYYDFVAELHR